MQTSMSDLVVARNVIDNVVCDIYRIRAKSECYFKDVYDDLMMYI